MSAALDLIGKIQAAGGEVVADGDRLTLKAPVPLPPDLVQEAKEHKAELLSALNRTLTPDLGDEKERFEERAAIMEYDGGIDRPEAERLARNSPLAEVIPLPLQTDRITEDAGTTAEGVRLCKVLNYNRQHAAQDGMACCDWCRKCKRNGGNCTKADLESKPHRCGDYQPKQQPE